MKKERLHEKGETARKKRRDCKKKEILQEKGETARKRRRDCK
jgi:hypothetical protein